MIEDVSIGSDWKLLEVKTFVKLQDFPDDWRSFKLEVIRTKAIPGVTKECFLEALQYLTSKQHPFKTPGWNKNIRLSLLWTRRTSRAVGRQLPCSYGVLVSLRPGEVDEVYAMVDDVTCYVFLNIFSDVCKLILNRFFKSTSMFWHGSMNQRRENQDVAKRFFSRDVIVDSESSDIILLLCSPMFFFESCNLHTGDLDQWRRYPKHTLALARYVLWCSTRRQHVWFLLTLGSLNFSLFLGLVTGELLQRVHLLRTVPQLQDDWKAKSGWTQVGWSVKSAMNLKPCKASKRRHIDAHREGRSHERMRLERIIGWS